MPKINNRAARRADAVHAETNDSFKNLMSKLGLAGGNNSGFTSYLTQRGLYTRQREQLNGLYQGSWVAGTIIDVVADDMTRAGVTIHNAPDAPEQIETTFRRTGMWAALNEGIKWARLYGGAAVMIVVKGQRADTPLVTNTIGRGQLAGFRVFTRHDLVPVDGRLIREGEDMGLPELYRLPLSNELIHHTRLIRFVGQKLPPDLAVQEQGWGYSVLERIMDRIVQFDTVSASAALLVQRAHNRVMRIKDFRMIMAQRGPQLEALERGLKLMKEHQDLSGLTVTDAEDTYESHTYSFAGLPEVVTQFASQLSGASGIPMVRWFGQSPGGLNATGESDFRIYYDTINQRQESDLRPGMARLLELAHWSATGSAPPEGMDFTFTPLWQMSAEQRGNIGKVRADSIATLVNAGVLNEGQALRELHATSDDTGLGATITDEEIEEAENEPPMPTNVELQGDPEAGDNTAEATRVSQTQDSAFRRAARAARRFISGGRLR